jgi:hypothetical protein
MFCKAYAMRERMPVIADVSARCVEPAAASRAVGDRRRTATAHCTNISAPTRCMQRCVPSKRERVIREA